MKTTKTVYAHKEHINRYGVRISDTVYMYTTNLSSGKVYKKEYVWLNKTGSLESCLYSCNSEKRMKDYMEKHWL